MAFCLPRSSVGILQSFNLKVKPSHTCIPTQPEPQLCASKSYVAFTNIQEAAPPPSGIVAAAPSAPGLGVAGVLHNQIRVQDFGLGGSEGVSFHAP